MISSRVQAKLIFEYLITNSRFVPLATLRNAEYNTLVETNLKLKHLKWDQPSIQTRHVAMV